MKRLLPLRVLLPLALGVIVSLGVLGFAEIGYRRLEFANRAMSSMWPCVSSPAAPLPSQIVLSVPRNSLNTTLYSSRVIPRLRI